MFKKKLGISLLCLFILSCRQENPSASSSETTGDAIKVIPISHGTLILEHEDMVVYVDPVGGAKAFKDQKKPGIILVTDIHGDHLNVETLLAITQPYTKLVVPIVVAEQIPDSLKGNISLMVNFQSKEFKMGKTTIGIEAIPMYNLREEALQFHTKGRGNGYVLTLGGERIYISGDTEDIPEMRALKDIDRAFVCMNLPWTMPVDRAASAVLEFQPKTVYPYHYKGTDGLSDVETFKRIVEKNSSGITVRLLNWYPNR